MKGGGVGSLGFKGEDFALERAILLGLLLGLLSSKPSGGFGGGSSPSCVGVGGSLGSASTACSALVVNPSVACTVAIGMISSPPLTKFDIASRCAGNSCSCPASSCSLCPNSLDPAVATPISVAASGGDARRF